MSEPTPSTSGTSSRGQGLEGLHELKCYRTTLIDRYHCLANERDEYRNLLKCMRDVENDRTCFELKDGALMQKTAQDVYPDIVAKAVKLDEELRFIETEIHANSRLMSSYYDSDLIKAIELLSIIKRADV